MLLHQHLPLKSVDGRWLNYISSCSHKTKYIQRAVQRQRLEIVAYGDLVSWMLIEFRASVAWCISYILVFAVCYISCVFYLFHIHCVWHYVIFLSTINYNSTPVINLFLYTNIYLVFLIHLIILHFLSTILNSIFRKQCDTVQAKQPWTETNK